MYRSYIRQTPIARILCLKRNTVFLYTLREIVYYMFHTFLQAETFRYNKNSTAITLLFYHISYVVYSEIGRRLKFKRRTS